MKQRERVWCVYWLYDDTCELPSHDGYIGCCSRLDVRLRGHRNGPGTYKGAIGVPTNFKVEILYQGSEDECRAKERSLRPTKRIGWNRNRGGGRSPYGYKHNHTKAHRRKLVESAQARFAGVPKSAKQREKMHQAGIDRYADRKPRSPTQERERLAKNAKRAACRAAGLPRLY
jgi:hypothetical protein